MWTGGQGVVATHTPVLSPSGYERIAKWSCRLAHAPAGLPRSQSIRQPVCAPLQYRTSRLASPQPQSPAPSPRPRLPPLP